MALRPNYYSQVCLEPPRSYNAPESLEIPPKEPWFSAVIRYGNSPMHAKTRAMEALCKSGRARKLALEQRRYGRTYKYTKAYKTIRDDQLKLKEQAEIIRDCGGLRLHFPDKKNGGNSNCGNSANR